MSNLEELFLNLSIERYFPDNSFIDGNNLKKDIINHMPKLNNFVFSILSSLQSVDFIHLPPNKDIQHTFKGLEDYQIVSYIDYFPNEEYGQCHIYSHPYTMNCLYQLTNSFPGGLFKFVHKVSLFDERPFEHEFFIRIAYSFPFLKTLIIDNESPQNHKQYQNLPIIEYPHLTVLRLYACDDYIEQFLDDTKACLSNYITLFVDYHTLQRVTYNFTRDTTRINCTKVKYLYTRKYNVPKHFRSYFPHVEKFV